MRRKHVTFTLIAIFLIWNVIAYIYLLTRPKTQGKYLPNVLQPEEKVQLTEKLKDLADAIASQGEWNQYLLKQLQDLKSELEGNHKNIAIKQSSDGSKLVPVIDKPGSEVEIPILMIACNRPDALRASLKNLIDSRPSSSRFPIVVSQDCMHQPTADVVRSFGNQIKYFTQQPDQSPIKDLKPKEKKLEGYYKISRHYKWALTQVFDVKGYKAAVIVEDDLVFAKDFFEYMEALYPYLIKDPTLFCVSAWNDNGKESMVDKSLNEKLYRTDFFPGLGWMITSNLWSELRDKWPKGFWDDWLRQPDQRKDRQCIRPEIPRTEISPHGKKGVSKGQFFDKHLKFIKMNTEFVPFRKLDLSYLNKDRYDSEWVKGIYKLPLVSVDDVLKNKNPEHKEVRIEYVTKNDFKSLAKRMGIMDDFKSGVPRMGYRGIIPLILNRRRVFFSPPPTWTKYDTTWS